MDTAKPAEPEGILTIELEDAATLTWWVSTLGNALRAEITADGWVADACGDQAWQVHYKTPAG